ncbi:MAG: MFS transporter [Janthinobacterium lividum]
MRELLRHRDFRLLLAGQTLSMFGDWTLLLVFGIWAKTLTGSNAIAGLTVLAMAAPGLLGPFAGVLVDRLPRRAVMVGLNAASAAVVCTLWFVDDRRQLWLLFAVAVWYGFSTVMFNAAMSGLVQTMLPVEHVGQANGLLATVRQALRLIGPVVGAGLFTAVGGHWVATLDATTFVLSSAALLLLRHREGAPTRQTVPFWTELSAGLRHLWTTPLLRAVTWTTVIFSLGIGAIEPTIYALVDGLDRPANFVGVLVSVQGGGAILGGLGVSAAIRRVPEPKLVTVGLALVATGIALCALPAVPAALAGFVLIGAGLPTLTVAVATLLQRSTPNQMMGRVAAGYDAIGTVPTTASIALGAVLVGIWPYQLILALSAAGCAAAAILMIMVSRSRVRQVAKAPSANVDQSINSNQAVETTRDR